MTGTNVEVTDAPVTELDADWLIVTVPSADGLDGSLAELDGVLDGQLGRLAEREDLPQKLGATLTLPDVPSLSASRLLLVGLGDLEKLDLAGWRKAMMTAARVLTSKADRSVAVVLPTLDDLSPEQIAEEAATALRVAEVGQAFHKSEPKRFALTGMTFHTESDTDAIGQAVERGLIIGDSINETRELVNRPADEIYPDSFAKQAELMAENVDLLCDILDEDEMREEGMGSLLAVAKGSDEEARLVVLRHLGGGENAPVIAICGKGVTFDSGGLSLKLGDNMLTMKMDMAGAATVFGVMLAVARLKLPVNVIGVMGLVENMVSGGSYKLGDILKSRSGTTIEVLNTDAEGRLVLADVLDYAVDLGADRLIDLATLTGACVVALGEEVVGVFGNDQKWTDTVLTAINESAEQGWPLPMDDHFGDLLESDVADTKNVGPRWGGAITAAKFLEKFVSERPWVHLDIAGPAFASGDKPDREGGATGVMVRSLLHLLESHTANID